MDVRLLCLTENWWNSMQASDRSHAFQLLTFTFNFMSFCSVLVLSSSFCVILFHLNIKNVCFYVQMKYYLMLM